MAQADFTTLERVKTQLALTDTINDLRLQQSITTLSQQIRSWLSRGDLRSRSYTRTFVGTNTRRLMLPDYPVTAVSSLIVGTQSIPQLPVPSASQPPVYPAIGYGYRLEQWDGVPPGRPITLQLEGARFWSGPQDVLVSYTAGYLATETWAVPAGGGDITPNQIWGIVVADAGVTYAATGLPLTAEPAGSTLAAGQYIAPGVLGVSSATGTAPFYQFAAADAGQSIVLTYSFLPAAIEQACIDAVSTTFAYADLSLSQNAREIAAGGTRMGFLPLGTAPRDRSGRDVFLTPAITAALQPYRRVAPI